jgi:hypothetical protein
MKLCELMSTGDDNGLGRVIDNAMKSLNRLKSKSDNEIRELAASLIQILENLEANPNIMQADGHSLIRYITMLSKPSVGKNTLRLVADSLRSYCDHSYNSVE